MICVIYSLYLSQKYHFTSMQLGYFVSWLAGFMSIAMLFIIRVMVRYFTTKQILYFSIIMSIVGIFIAMAPTITIQWISVIPIACGTGLAYPTILTLFSNAVSNDLQGWIMDVSAAIIAAASAAGGLLIAGVSMYYTITFISMGILWILCFLFSLKIMPNKK